MASWTFTPWFAEFCLFLFSSFVVRRRPAKCPRKNIGDRAVKARTQRSRFAAISVNIRQIHARHLAANVDE
jgi:hypothetical protein